MPESTITELALIKISGVDAADFLQGQLTNDVMQLDSQWRFSGYCNPQGRLLALLRLWQSEDDFYALVANDLVETICRRLKMYVLRSKVQIEHCEDASMVFFADRQSLLRFNPDFAQLPEQITQNNVTIYEGEFLLSDTATQSYLYVEQHRTHDSGTGQQLEQAWLRSNILAGIPQIDSATSELFVPQMINLDLLDGINFKKGCYTGQEIVARMHYLGKLKQRLLLCDLKGQSNSPAQAGDKIFADDAGSKNSGTLLLIDPEANIALAVIRLAELKSEHRLANGQQLSVREQQPYAVPL